MGDSGLEILHGGVGGDVEQGARTSKHIFVFAFDPLISLTLSLSLSFICAKHHSSFISYLLAFVLCLALFHIAYILHAWLFVCGSLILNQQELHIAPLPIQGESRGVSPELFTGNSAALVDCIKCVCKLFLASVFSAFSFID